MRRRRNSAGRRRDDRASRRGWRVPPGDDRAAGSRRGRDGYSWSAETPAPAADRATGAVPTARCGVRRSRLPDSRVHPAIAASAGPSRDPLSIRTPADGTASRNIRSPWGFLSLLFLNASVARKREHSTLGVWPRYDKTAGQKFARRSDATVLVPQGEKGTNALPRPERGRAEQRLLRRGLRAPVLRRCINGAAEFGGGVPAPARVVEHAAGQRDHVGLAGGHDLFGLLRLP